MSVHVEMVDGPIAARLGAGEAGAGAEVVFRGVVRGREGDGVIEALEYTAYEPMAGRELLALAEDVVRRHGLLGLHVRHSRGRVTVGECSFELWVYAAHRKEALAAMEEFIDRLKRDVPIWKRAVWRAG